MNPHRKTRSTLASITRELRDAKDHVSGTIDGVGGDAREHLRRAYAMLRDALDEIAFADHSLRGRIDR